MTNLSPEMIEQAKFAKSVEELLAIAKENGIRMPPGEAETYFEQIHAAELDDDLLDGVAGGWLVGGAGQENSSEVLRKKSTRSQCG